MDYRDSRTRIYGYVCRSEHILEGEASDSSFLYSGDEFSSREDPAPSSIPPPPPHISPVRWQYGPRKRHRKSFAPAGDNRSHNSATWRMQQGESDCISLVLLISMSLTRTERGAFHYYHSVGSTDHYQGA